MTVSITVAEIIPELESVITASIVTISGWLLMPTRLAIICSVNSGERPPDPMLVSIAYCNTVPVNVPVPDTVVRPKALLPDTAKTLLLPESVVTLSSVYFGTVLPEPARIAVSDSVSSAIGIFPLPAITATTLSVPVTRILPVPAIEDVTLLDATTLPTAVNSVAPVELELPLGRRAVTSSTTVAVILDVPDSKATPSTVPPKVATAVTVPVLIKMEVASKVSWTVASLLPPVIRAVADSVAAFVTVSRTRERSCTWLNNHTSSSKYAGAGQSY